MFINEEWESALKEKVIFCRVKQSLPETEEVEVGIVDCFIGIIVVLLGRCWCRCGCGCVSIEVLMCLIGLDYPFRGYFCCYSSGRCH